MRMKKIMILENNEYNNYVITIASDFDSYLTINFIEKIIYVIFLLL